MKTMTMSEIRRQLVDIPDATEVNLALAEEAECLLGYSAFKKAVAATETDTMVLARALKQIEIEILNAADVERYKTETMKEQAKIDFDRWLNDPTATNQFFAESWGEVEIKEYRKPIPEFVLNKAVQIKKALPEVELFICGLGVHPDPFLVAKLRKEVTADWVQNGFKYKSDVESYYVEVWDEPKFEASL